MNTLLLGQWLGLPPGAWPPAARPLLGLPTDGPIDAAAAERNALARMEQLRPHQLRHPDLVTEGMNRIAQALIAVTSGPVAAPPPTSAAPKKRKPAPLPPPAPSPLSLAPTVPAPEVFEAEVYEADVIADAEPVNATVVEWQQPSPAEVVAEPLPPPDVESLPEPDAPPPGVAFDRADRRLGYRTLVFLRHLAELWDEAATVFGSPSEPVRSAVAVYAVLTAGRKWRALRAKHEDIADGRTGPGSLVTAVLGQPHAVTVLREMTVSQRVRLAADWAAGRSRLASEAVAVRAAVRGSRPRDGVRRFVGATSKAARRHPEWVLVALGVLLLAVGFVRMMTH